MKKVYDYSMVIINFVGVCFFVIFSCGFLTLIKTAMMIEKERIIDYLEIIIYSLNYCLIVVSIGDKLGVWILSV